MTERVDAEFVPIRPNPFIVGNPVRDRNMFFGREAEFEFVRKRFEHSTRGGLLVFCGERRSGKTSILFQILDRRLGPEFIPVLIDMQSMAVGNEIEFLTRLSQEVLAALGPDAGGIELPVFTEGSNHSATFQKFIRALLRMHGDRKLILLFDEYELFENKIDAGLLSDDVLYVLANLIENDPVFLVFTGSQHLEQRRHEYWKILGKSLYKTISYLDHDDAVRLICNPVEGRVRYGAGTVDAIWRLTAGQPFYTQAVCQRLVDTLNERRTAEASPEVVADVVDEMINNPLPQMIFMWDALARDEKLALALLAEGVGDERDAVDVDRLLRLMRERKYPLDLDRARIATMLEKLFKSELLLRNDRGSLPQYCFRMDLWRRWVRRQHSVWQVIREEGLAMPRLASPRRVRTVAMAAGGLAILVAIFVSYRATREPRSPQVPHPPPRAASGFFSLEVTPGDAVVYLDGRRVGIGSYRDSIAGDVEHRVVLKAAGYADTSVMVRIPRSRAGSANVEMRALLGTLRVETVPPGAEVRVDGRLIGRSPVSVPGLGVARPHRVEATTAQFGAAQQEVRLAADTVTRARLVLQPGKIDVLITSDPAGGSVQRDGASVGTTPLQAGMTYGRHVVAVSRPGFTAVESTLVVGEQTRQVHFALAAEAPGVLVVQGDLPAEIYVDDALVVSNVQNSGPRPLGAGRHAVRVILVKGDTVDTTVTIRSRERTTYDFSRGTVISRVEKDR